MVRIRTVVLDLTKENEDKLAARAAHDILAGNLIIYPTDTVYGLGANAFLRHAVEKVFHAKGRTGKPVSVMFANHAMMQRFLAVDKKTMALMRKKKGRYTFVINKRVKKHHIYTGNEREIGVRIAATSFTKKLIKRTGVPITATSANVSGHPAPREFRYALEGVGNHCSLAINAGKANATPSTVIDIRGRIKTLRK